MLDRVHVYKSVVAHPVYLMSSEQHLNFFIPRVLSTFLKIMYT